MKSNSDTRHQLDFGNVKDKKCVMTDSVPDAKVVPCALIITSNFPFFAFG